MGREASQKKSRRCRKCRLKFIDMNAAQIQMHAFVCNFEKTTGIEVIKMGPTDAEEDAKTPNE